MRTLDDIDRKILELLSADARRPFSDIAEHVDLSAPAVSDRVDRLEEIGVIEGFTVQIDPGSVSTGVRVLVTIDVPHSAITRTYDELVDHERVESVFRTADGEVICVATLDPSSIERFREEIAEDPDGVDSFEVTLLADRDRDPTLGGTIELAIDCVECDNTVTSEGESARIDGSIYHFCCDSCRSNFEDRYEQLREGV